jgi:chitinase
MIWAIDLDDGTLIEALGKGIKRKKSKISQPQRAATCFGTGSMDKNEL